MSPVSVISSVCEIEMVMNGASHTPDTQERKGRVPFPAVTVTKNEGDLRLSVPLVFTVECVSKGELAGLADTWGARGREMENTGKGVF